MRFFDRMMSSYRQRERHGRLWAATMFVVLLFVFDFFTHGALRALVRSTSAVLSRTVGHTVSEFAQSGIFSSRAALQAQNRSLAEQMNTCQVRAAFVTVLQNENDQLRALVHLARSMPGITAPVTSSVAASPYGTFLIGAGSADGVADGALVLVSDASGNDSFVVGKVTQVSSRVSTVSEVFAPSSSVSVIVHGNVTTLSGSGGGNAHVSLPRDASVAVGDAVFSADLGGHPVGIVGHVASSSAQASQDVYVSVPVNLNALQYVYVVSP